MAVDARAMPGRLPATVTLSVAAHAGLVCLVMLVAATRPAPRHAIRSLITSVVSLETPAPTPPTPPPVPVDIETPPPPAAAAPPRTAPQPVARASTPQPAPAAQAPAAPAAPSPVLAAPQGTDAPAVADGPPSAAPVVAAAAHAGPATAPVGVESAPAAAAGPMMDVGAYLSNLRDRVSRHRRYPEMALQLGLEGVVEVAVVVRPDGTLAAAPSVAESSGHDILDEEALRIVARAAPFPPLTGHREPVRLRVPVNFHLD